MTGMPSDATPRDASKRCLPCERVRDLLGAFQDSELRGDDRDAVAAHLTSCASCTELLADNQRIGRTLRQHGRLAAPPALAARISAALDTVDREPVTAMAAPAPFKAPARQNRLTRYATQAAAMAAACSISAGATWWMMVSGNQSGMIERELLNAHLRSLLQDSQVQIASSDQHTVRPWFTGRADFAPGVKDLKAEGFPLTGGRLDYVADRRAAVLVYQRKLHVINVFMWPAAAAGESAPRLSTRSGYNMLSWTRNAVTYAAVSDLNAAELRQLQSLL
jgi:anti-sigma factor RsiW